MPTSPEQAPSDGGFRSTTSFDLGEEEASIGRRQRSPPPSRVAFAHDPRFDVPTPPMWQRAGLILFIVFLFWLGTRLRGSVEEGVSAVLE